MPIILEPIVTIRQELIVPMLATTIGSMHRHPELSAFAARMHEICDDLGLPVHGRQSEVARVFGISQKGARKWLEAEAFPRWEHIIRITEWAGVSVDWLVSGRGAKRPTTIYPNATIEHVATVMQAMEPQQQYLLARLADQVAQPDQGLEHPPKNGSTGTSE